MSLYGAALLGLPGVIQNPARAAVATLPTAGTAAAASATVAVAAVGGGATIVVQTNGWKAFFGAALATGGLALGVVDPPGGTFFDGSFTYNYPSSLFEVDLSCVEPGQSGVLDRKTTWQSPITRSVALVLRYSAWLLFFYDLCYSLIQSIA
jgi:hypothetical protein